MINGQKNFNVNIDEQLSDAFSAQVDERGYTKYRAIEGALRAFMALEPKDQVKLISTDANKVLSLKINLASSYQTRLYYATQDKKKWQSLCNEISVDPKLTKAEKGHLQALVAEAEKLPPDRRVGLWKKPSES